MKRVDNVPMPLELSPDELRILAAFRAVDARGKREALELLELDAARYPMRAVPALRLVTGGGL